MRRPPQGATLRDGLRTRLWPVPALGILVGLALGIGLPRLDAHVDGELGPGVTDYIFSGGASAARTLLGAIAGSLITVTSLTFSLTVVTLQLASSQFSPRLLRTFTRDLVVQGTLALFLGTFTFALAVLRTVRDATDAREVVVPQISVTLAFVLGILSVLGLVLFLAHLAREIRVETMLRTVHDEARATVRRELEDADRAAPPVARADPPPDATPILAGGSGFLLRVDEELLLRAAVEADVTLIITRAPGSSLVLGTPVGAAWVPSGTTGSARLEQLGREVAEALVIGAERTSAGDVAFGLRQLADVTIRALSPGTNDPTTAVHAIGHSSALLCELTAKDLRDRQLEDEHGRVRVVLRRPGFDELLELAIGQPRRYGAGDPLVVLRLLALLGEVAWHANRSEHRRAITDQLARLQATVADADFDSAEAARIRGMVDGVHDALAQRVASATRTP